MKIRITLFILLFHVVVLAQTRFTVFKTIGGVQFFSTKSNQWETLKPKDTITGETKIKCMKNTSLVFFDLKFQIFEMKQEGVFMVKNAINTNNSNTSEEMRKAVKYFVEQTFAANSNGSTQKAKGAVYRGKESVFPWDSTEIMEDTFEVAIHLPKAEYPVLVSLNEYTALIFHDTTLHLAVQHLKSNQFNELIIGKQVIHLRNKQDSIAKQVLISIMNNKGLSIEAQFSMAIAFCIAKGYYSSAKEMIDRLHKTNKETYQMVTEWLKDNQNFQKLIAF